MKPFLKQAGLILLTVCAIYGFIFAQIVTAHSTTPPEITHRFKF